MKKKTVVIVLIVIAIILTGYLLFVRSFDSILDVRDRHLRVMTEQLNGQQNTEIFHDQTSDNTNRILSLLRQYKYIKLLSNTPEAYTDEMLIFMTFSTDKDVSTMEIITNGKVVISDGKRTMSYIALSGRRLFSELYDIIEINDAP